jgi:ABC-type multidrug transport system fused ATPase/permease subunit
MERDITTEFENLSTQMKDHQTKHAFWRNLSSRLIYIGTAVLSSLLYAFGGFWLLVDGMDVGTIVALSSRVGSLFARFTLVRHVLMLVFV